MPHADDSVGVIEAFDVLQRIPDRASFFNEMYRVLAPGGVLLTSTPSTDGRGAFQDPSHVAYYNENSFMYLSQAGLRVTLPTLASRWQISHLHTHYPSDAHELMNISYVDANLLPVKGEPREGGPVLC